MRLELWQNIATRVCLELLSEAERRKYQDLGSKFLLSFAISHFTVSEL